MLGILGSTSPFRHGPSRREVLSVGALSAIPLTLPQWFGLVEARGESKPNDLLPVKAKRILLLYLQGAASQFETWDPKPNAPQEIRGKWGAISTVVPGVFICEKLSKLARLVDRMAIVRSMTHEHNNHSNLYTCRDIRQWILQAKPTLTIIGTIRSSAAFSIIWRSNRPISNLPDCRAIWGCPIDSASSRRCFDELVRMERSWAPVTILCGQSLTARPRKRLDAFPSSICLRRSTSPIRIWA